MGEKRWSVAVFVLVGLVLSWLPSATTARTNLPVAVGEAACDVAPTEGTEPRHPYLDAQQTGLADTASFYGYSHNPYVYSLYVPSNLPPDADVPLLIGLHGLGQGARDFEDNGLQELADRKGLIVAIPSGLRSWWATEDSFDVKFVRDVVADVRSERCIDARRIYAIGASNGGFMAQRLACDASDLFAAIVSVAGTSVETTYPVGGPCLAGEDAAPGAEPVPIFFSYGQEDQTVSYETGLATVRRWVDRYRCDSKPVRRDSTDWGPIEQYGNCNLSGVASREEQTGVPFELPFLTLVGHDHIYPNGCGGFSECEEPDPDFPTADEFNDLLYEFLSRHTRAARAPDQALPDPTDMPMRDPQRHGDWLTQPDHGPVAALVLVGEDGGPVTTASALDARVVRVEYVVDAPEGYPPEVLDHHPDCPSTSPGVRKLRYTGRPVTLRITDRSGSFEHVEETQEQPGTGAAVATFAIDKVKGGGPVVVEVTTEGDRLRSSFLCTAKAARFQETVSRRPRARPAG